MKIRKQSGAIPCPSCRQLVDVNAERCPFCNRWRPGLWGFGPYLSRILGGGYYFTWGIFATCIVFYLVELMKSRGQWSGDDLFSIGGPSGEVLYAMGMTGSFPLFHEHAWWTAVTAMYLHGGFIHILFNLLWLRDLGPVIEELYGPGRFFTIFTVSGVIGNVVASYFGTPFLIGASGGVFGLLGALVAYGRRRGGTFGAQIRRYGLYWAAIGIALSFILPRISIWAHAGGFAGGLLVGAAVSYQERRREGPWLVLLAGTLALFTVACFVLAFLHAAKGS